MTQNHQGDTMRALLLVAAISATSAAATLDAQAMKGKPDSTCTKYTDGRVECGVFRRFSGDSAFGNRIFLRMDSAMANRAALGIELRATGTHRDTLGVFVAAVTPKGPAESAGIIEGDRIAAINGVDLRTPLGDIDDSFSDEVASHRLTREVQKLTPGSRVTLRIYSGGRLRDVQVVAGKASDIMRFGNHFRMEFPGGEGMMEYDPRRR
jgi:PDZ domain